MSSGTVRLRKVLVAGFQTAALNCFAANASGSLPLPASSSTRPSRSWVTCIARKGMSLEATVHRPVSASPVGLTVGLAVGMAVGLALGAGLALAPKDTRAPTTAFAASQSAEAPCPDRTDPPLGMVMPT